MAGRPLPECREREPLIDAVRRFNVRAAGRNRHRVRSAAQPPAPDPGGLASNHPGRPTAMLETERDREILDRCLPCGIDEWCTARFR